MRHRGTRDGSEMKILRLRRRLLAGSALCLGLWAVAGDAAAMTLTEALAAAYTNNPTLQAQRARLRETDESVPQALSGWKPTVTFTGSTGFNRAESSAPVVTRTPTSAQSLGVGQELTLSPRTLDLNVTQPIYRGGRTAASTSQAENLVRAARATTLLTEQQVLFQVATSFMDVV
jgi:outer membrane protein